MNFRKYALVTAAAFAIAACGQSANGQSESPSPSPSPSDVRNDATQPVSDAKSGTYSAEERHRYITFSYFHQGFSYPWVRWRNWDATLEWDAENPAESSVNVVIDATSVDSGVDVFDGHLQGERFFDSANYPEITFESTNVKITGEKTGVIEGELTIKDITKPVTLDVVFNKGVYDERGNQYKLGFSAKTSVNRTDYGMDYLVPAVSDKVDIVIEAEFTMPAGDSE